MSGLVINPIWDTSVTSATNAAQIETAVNAEIKILEATFTNNVVLNLHVGWGEVNGQIIPAGAIAEGGYDTYETIPYAKVAAALAGRAASFPATDPNSAGSVSISDPNAVALGLLSGPTVGYIGLGNAISWDFAGGATIGANLVDFQGVVAHEITHVLGRYSDTSVVSPWLIDFFRYSAPGVHDFNILDANTYFSANGGTTVGRYFDTSSDQSDWADDPKQVDSFAEAALQGAKLPVSAVDLALMQALGWNVAGATVDYSATIKSAYDTFFGRDPSAAETSVWQNLLNTGSTAATLRSALVNDGAGQAYITGQITSLYDTYFGRDPSAGEISVWKGLIVGGSSTGTLRAALLADPAGQAHTTAQVTTLYDTYFGRDPSAGELSIWQGLIAGGSDFTTLRSALVNDVNGQNYIAGQVKTLYDTYFGRDPSAGEVSVWKGLIVGGADFNTLRSALVNDGAGHAHTTQMVTSLYDTYFGRDPSAGELSVWQGLITGGATFTTLRSALISDGYGQAYAASQITSLYDTYFGRDPSAGEISIWKGLIAGGADFGTLRSALLNDGSGQAHTAATITSLYDTYFGRDPSAGEVGVWKGLIAGGDTFLQLQDTLDRVTSSSSVPHFVGTGGNQTLFSSQSNYTVDNYDPSKIQLVFSPSLGGINILDSNHAHQITALDGSTDVLLTLDATHSVLLEHTTLASLTAYHGVDFIFALLP